MSTQPQFRASRLAQFFLVPDYQSRGARVVLMVGPRWTPHMRKHYGVMCEPFHVRAALNGEPDVDERGHPFGWVYKPDELIKEEARWSTPQQLQMLRTRLEQALQPAEEKTQ